MSTNLLCPIDSGAISADVEGDAIKVSYRVHTVRLCVMTTVMALGAVAVTLSANLDLTRAGEIGLLAWLWLFGANYVVALLRFRWFVKDCVREGLAESSHAARRLTVTS